MALNSSNKIAIWATIREAYQLLWQYRWAYLVICAVTQIVPFAIATSLELNRFQEGYESPSSSDSGLFDLLLTQPFGFTLLGFLALSAFSFCLLRTFVAGQRGLIDIGLREGATMLLRVTLALGGFFIAWFVILWVFLIAPFMALSESPALIQYFATVPGSFDALVFLTRAHPVIVLFVTMLLLAKCAPIFPSFVARNAPSIRACWRANKNSLSRLFVVTVVACLPLWALVRLAELTLTPAVASFQPDALIQWPDLALWSFKLSMTPITRLSEAILCAIAAIVYRDLFPSTPTIEPDDSTIESRLRAAPAYSVSTGR